MQHNGWKNFRCFGQKNTGSKLNKNSGLKGLEKKKIRDTTSKIVQNVFTMMTP